MSRRRCRPWSHQWFLRLDDWRVMCTECTAVKTDRRHRPMHLAGRVLIDPTTIKETIVNYRDTLERLAWTTIAAVLGVLAETQLDAGIWWVPLFAAAVNWLTLLARKKVAALPNPGAGLPGLPVE